MQIDEEVSDVRQEDVGYRRDLIDEKNVFDSRDSRNQSGSRMKNINQSQMSMMRLADTPHQDKKRRRKGQKSQDKGEVEQTH